MNLDDLLYLLAAYGNTPSFPGADIAPAICDDAGRVCNDPSDCVLFNTDCQVVVIGDQTAKRCALVDLDDLTILLEAFGGMFPAIGDPCSPGACKNIPPTPCVTDLNCPPLVACVSGFCDLGVSACYDAGIPGGGQSMSNSDCIQLGGIYCGDYSECGDPGCP